jgi:hypothetical protein
MFTTMDGTVGAGAAYRYGSGSEKNTAPCGSGSATLLSSQVKNSYTFSWDCPFKYKFKTQLNFPYLVIVQKFYTEKLPGTCIFSSSLN